MSDKYSKFFSYSITQLDKTFNPNNEGFEFDLVLGKDKYKAVASALLKNKKPKEVKDIWHIVKPTMVRGKLTDTIVDTITTANIHEYLDPKMFANELLKALEVVEEERTERNNRSEMTAIVGRELSEIVRKSLPLALPASTGDYNDVDAELFSWFAVDSNADNPAKKNIYMRLADGSYSPIFINAISKKAEFIDPQLFHDTYRDRYIRWATDAQNVYNTCRDIIKSDMADSTIDNILEEIHKVLPKAVMQESKLELCFVPNKDNDLLFDSVKLQINNNTNKNKAVWNEINVEDMMQTIIPRLNKSKMPVLKRYSIDLNDPAILKLPLDYISKLVESDNPLPEIWKSFLDSKFDIDKEAQLYRLAKFMVSVIDPSNKSRQMLCLADKGHSGKSTFIKAIQKGLNRLAHNSLFAKQANNIALAKQDKSQDGLEDIMDSRLIIATEVNSISDFVDAPNVKNITGGDTVIASVKYGKPVYKSMEGTKIIICTNNWVNVKNTAVESRIIPIVFKAFNGITDVNLSDKLAGSIEGFLAWCIKFVRDTETARHYKNKNICELYSSDHPEYTTKEIFEYLSSDGAKMFRYHLSEEYTDQDESYMSALCELLTIQSADESDSIEYRELMKGLKAANEKLGFSNYVVESFLNPRSKDYKALRVFIQSKYNANLKKSNGITKFYGIKIADPAKVRSYSGLDFVNSSSRPPKKEYRGETVIDPENLLDDSIA